MNFLCTESVVFGSLYVLFEDAQDMVMLNLRVYVREGDREAYCNKIPIKIAERDLRKKIMKDFLSIFIL